MKLRLNLTLRRCLLSAFAVVATLSTGNMAQGSILYSSVGMQTYTDFGQNCGRYQAGRVNDLLSSIRREEGGVKIYYIGEKFENYSFTLPHGMIDFSSGSVGSVDAAIGYGFLATVQHNGVQNPAYAAAEVGTANAVKYAGIEYRNGNIGLGEAADEVFLYCPHTDYKITRLSKLVTDVRTSDVYNNTEMLGQPLTGQFLYRAGSGTMKMAQVDENGMANAGEATGLRGAYSYVTGGLITIDGWGQRETQEGGDFNYSVNHTVPANVYGYITGEQASGQVNPLPYVSLAGDSGSPSWVWNEQTGTYQYLSALQSGGGTYSQDRGAWYWTLEKMESFNKRVELGEDSLIRFTAVNQEGSTISGNADNTTLTVTQHLGSLLYGEETIQFAGNQLNTWADLNDLRDEANWYTYGNGYLNANGNVSKDDDGKISYGELMHTDSIILTATTDSPYTVQLDDTVDTGIGFVQFSKADGVESARFNLVSENGEQNQLNTAGFVVDAGVTLDISLTGDSEYLREWRKVGEGDLRISGNGANDILLNVGGGSIGSNDGSTAGHTSGKVYIDRTDGYAAYNVLASTGSTIVLSNTQQVKHDVTLGAGGATLDLNGNDYTWNNSAENNDVFTLHMLTEKDILANHGESAATVTIKDAGDTLLGSFEDSESGAMKVIYDGGDKALAMHSVFTDLKHNRDSGFTVKSGSVSLGGTMTVHGTGSLTGTNTDRVENPNDWHYADAKMDVTVQKGATFTLDSHARLTGDVTVEDGGTFVMKEGTKHRYEYIEGGFFAEDTQNAFYSQFHGLKGNITLNDGALNIVYNAGVDAHNTYAGSISGIGSMQIDLGTSGAILTLGGDNSQFTPEIIEAVSGGVIAESKKAIGAKGNNATIRLQEKAWLGVKGAAAADILPYITTDSAGVLALTQHEEQQLGLGAFSHLIIGALEGTSIEYGLLGTDVKLMANADNQWLLGGGGGELVVNFALQNENGTLVLGNEYTTGSVTLTNTKNSIGSIVFGGKVTLGYTSEDALGGSDINLSYGNRLVGSEQSLTNITADSSGAMLVDNMLNTDVNLSGHTSLALGAAGNVSYKGNIQLGSSDTYRLGGVSGCLTLENVLSDNGKRTHLQVDGQGYSGGVVELKQAATLTGTVTVMGYDSSKTSTASGDITLRLSADNALATAASVTLNNSGILDVNGTRQQFNNLNMAAGSTLTDTSALHNGSATINVASGTAVDFNGNVEIGTLTKTGDGTLNLGGNNAYNLFNISGGTVVATSNTAFENAGITHVLSGATLDVRTVSAGGTLALSGGTLLVGSNLGGSVSALSGTAVINNNGGTSSVAAELNAAANATLQLTGGTYQLTNAAINEDSTIGGETIKSGTINVTANNLEIIGNETATIGGTLRMDGSAHRNGLITLNSNRGANNTIRHIAHLDIAEGTDLHITETTWNTIWNIHELTGTGTLTWDSKTTHWFSNRLILDGENSFTGTILANRQYTASVVRDFASYLELAHDKAAQNAHLSLTGNNDKHYMTLAVNTDNALVQSLSGNEYTALYAGAAATGRDKRNDEQTNTSGDLNLAPTSTRRATLTITGNTDAEFKGRVYGGNDGNGISLVMDSTATQKFTGDSIALNDITVRQGALIISTTGLNLAGDITLHTGATLQAGSNITLNEGHSLAVTGNSSAAATLNSVLLFNGGTLSFDAATLSADRYALTLNKSVGSYTDEVTLGFTNTSYLRSGLEYKLASGDWTGQDYTFNVTGVGYLTGTFNATATGLSVTFSAADGSTIWDGTAQQQTWSSSLFGQQSGITTSRQTLVFNDSAESQDVHLYGSQLAATLVFDNTQNYTLHTENGTVQTTDIHVVGSGNTTLGSGVSATGTVTVDNGSLTVKDKATLQGAQTIGGSGTLVLDLGTDSTELTQLGSIGTLRLASGHAETAAALNTSAVIIDKGASLSVTSDQDAAITLAGTGREGIDSAALYLSDGVSLNGAVNLTDHAVLAVNSGAATLTGTVNTGENTLTKTGVGTLNVAAASQLKAQGITVDGGELLVNRHNSDAKNVGILQLNNGTTFTQYSTEQPNVISTINTLIMGGETATVKTTHFDGSLQLGTLNLADGVSNATLNLVNDSDVERYTLFTLGRNGAEVGNYAGTINLSSTHSGNYRSATLVINKGDITKNAVINLASSVSGSASLGLGLHDGTVTAAGLKSGQTLGSRAYVYSGYSTANATKVTKENTVRTLAVNTTAETDATFYGAVEANINIIKRGEGAQTFAGSSESFNGTLSVQGGTLTLADSRMIRQAASISVGESGTLSLNGMMALSAPIIQNEGKLIFGSNAQYILDDISTPATYTLVNGSGSTEGLSLSNFLYDGHNLLGYSAGVRLLFSDNAVTLRITETPDSRTIIWNGTGESAVWDNGVTTAWVYEGDATEAYHRTDSVVFGAEGVKNVSIANGTASNAMTVQAGDYSFTGMAGLTVNGTLSINEGASAAFDALTANQTQQLTANGAVTAGATTINSGTAIFNSAAHFTNGIRIDGGTTTFNDTVTVDATTEQYEMVINRGTVNINGQMTVSGDVQLGNNSDGTAKALITIGKQGVLTVGKLNSAWGFDTLTVDGVLNTTHFNLSTGTTQTITGSGTINANHLTGGNAGTYNFSNLRLNIGNGGMDGSRTLRFTDMTLGALESWTADRTIDLAGTIVIDTAKVASESGEGTTITLKGLNTTGLTSLTKTGVGTLLLSNGISSYAGDMIVEEGTLQIGNNTALGKNAPNERTIRVDEKGTLDIKGCEGTNGYGYTVILNGGSLTNSGTTVGSGKMQVVTNLNLTANSAIHVGSDSNFGLIASGWGNTAIALNSHILEKTGAGTYYITNAAITGSGKLKVSEGTLQFDPREHGHLDSGIEMAGGTLAGTVKLGGNIAVDITKDSVISAEFQTECHTLTVNNDAVASTMSGALTGAGKLVKTGAQILTLTNGSASYTGGVEVQQGTLCLSGAAAGMMDRLTSLSVAADATLHLSTSGSFANKNWDASQALGNIELGNGTADMTVNASTFSELNSKATLILNTKAQYDGGGTGAAPATLNNNLILRTDGSRIALHNVDVLNGDITIEGTAVIASLQGSVNRSTTFNGTLRGDTLSVGGGERGAYQQFYLLTDKSDATELKNLLIGKSGNSNWTNVIVSGAQALAQEVSFDANCGKNSGRLFIEADNSISKLISDAGIGYTAITNGHSLTVKDSINYGGTLVLGNTLNKNITASGVSVGNVLSGDAYVTLKNNAEGTMQTSGELSMSADDTKQEATIKGDGKTVVSNTLIDLAAGTTLHLQDVVLADTSKLTDAPATVEMSNVTVQAKVGSNLSAGTATTLAAGTTLTQFGEGGKQQTLAQNEACTAYTLNSIENVSLKGNSMTIQLSDLTYEELLGLDTPWVGITLAGTAAFDTTSALEVYLSVVGGHDSDTIYTMLGYHSGSTSNAVYFNLGEAVPEPTTSTLSLLALAVLCARRRRKA